MEYKLGATTTRILLEQMAANAPLKIGSRGTIGSLVRKEIEYFKRIESDRRAITGEQPQDTVANAGSSCSRSRPSFWFFALSWRRKKRKRIRFWPSVCSVVEVSEANRLNGTSGFNYRILRDEAKSPSIYQ